MKMMVRKFIVLGVGLMMLGLATADLQGSKPERRLFLDISRQELSGKPSWSNPAGTDHSYASNTGMTMLETRRMLLRPTPSGKRPPPPNPHITFTGSTSTSSVVKTLLGTRYVR